MYMFFNILFGLHKLVKNGLHPTHRLNKSRPDNELAMTQRPTKGELRGELSKSG